MRDVLNLINSRVSNAHAFALDGPHPPTQTLTKVPGMKSVPKIVAREEPMITIHYFPGDSGVDSLPIH